MNTSGEISIHPTEGNTLTIRLSGNWTLGQNLPAPAEAARQIESTTGVERIRFDTQHLSAWDSGLLTFLVAVLKDSARKGVAIDKDGLPDGVQRLIALATAVPKKEDARKAVEDEPFLSRVGGEVLTFLAGAGELIGFIGEAVVATGRLFVGKASFRAHDLGIFLQESGAQAISIVTLISLLVGLILAFVGIIQLKIFGAQVFVADLVGIAMVRALAAVMTGIIMAGRTGAAYAAQLGTMQVNEEIDALKTLGINPMEFLVLPRMLALTAMMPLLCLYADLMGILGGWVVAVPMYGISSVQYFQRTITAVGLNDLFIGLFTSFVFGILVALAGCLRGMQCGRSASAVGDAATSAVVTGIVAIIISMALITVLCDVMGI